MRIALCFPVEDKAGILITLNTKDELGVPPNNLHPVCQAQITERQPLWRTDYIAQIVPPKFHVPACVAASHDSALAGHLTALPEQMGEAVCSRTLASRNDSRRWDRISHIAWKSDRAVSNHFWKETEEITIA